MFKPRITGAVVTLALIAAASDAAATATSARFCPQGPAPSERPLAASGCTAAAPREGQTFAGPVVQVIDGRTVCLAQGPTPSDWVLVRLDGLKDDAPRDALMAAAFARRVTCLGEGPAQQATLARCTLDGLAIEAAARAPKTLAEASGWR